MRVLKTTVVAGGVLYPAGTPATADLVDLIAERHWAGDGISEDEVDAKRAADIADLTEVFKAEVAKKDQVIADLAAQRDTLLGRLGELENAAQPTQTPETPPPAPVDYSYLDLDALKAEIDKRNQGRDDSTRISKRGSVETLAAALTADDQA